MRPQASVLALALTSVLAWLFGCATFSKPAGSGMDRRSDLVVTPLAGTPEFIEDWYVCGPFPREGSRELRACWGSENVREKASAANLLERSYETKTGEAGWQLRRIQDARVSSADPRTGEIRTLQTRIIDFLESFPEASVESSAYALALLDAPTEQARTLFAGSDDGITVWLNGEEIHDVERERPIVPDEDLVIASFRAGLNVLLVEVRNARGYWGFTLRLLPLSGPPPVPQSLGVLFE